MQVSVKKDIESPGKMGGQTCLFIFQYSMADILDIVQASEAEISTALLKMQALIIDGRFNSSHAKVFKP